MEGELLKVEKLQNAEEFELWKFQVSIILKANEIYEFVTGEAEKLLKDTTQTDDQHKAAIKLWSKGDSQAQKVIATTIGRNPLQHIVNCKTAAEMWDRLQTVYEQRSKENIHILQQKFYNYSKCVDDDIATYISKLETIVRQLRDAGEEISDSMVITKILMSLPEENNNFSTAWESTSSENKTLANLTARLIAEEVRHTSQNSDQTTGNALVARKGKHYYRKQKNNNQKTHKPGKCFNCQQTGHWKRECKLKKERNKRTDNMQTGNIAACEGDALVVYHSNIRSNEWYLDSGASDHMSPNKHWFTNYTLFEKEIKVRIGNGETISAVGKGEIQIIAYNGKEWLSKRLLNVLYVPDISFNLFSQSSALDKNLHLSSNKERCVFKNNSGDIVAVGVREEKLFRMMFKVINNEEESVANVANKNESLKL